MDFSPAGTGRMLIALGVLAALALSAWLQMDEGKYRTLVLVLMAFFAVRVWLGWMRARKLR